MKTRSYWLMKSEPDVFGILDLKNAKNQTTMWEGVRNYEARNYMRDKMVIGDLVLFYHSNSTPPSIVGTAIISSESYPDPSQFDTESDYYDPKSSLQNPRWFLVNVTFMSIFKHPVTRAKLQEHPVLSNMMLFKRNRLSITPVTEDEWNYVNELSEEN
jgi:predicted RNA-binding protein with PUA-like domain